MRRPLWGLSAIGILVLAMACSDDVDVPSQDAGKDAVVDTAFPDLGATADLAGDLVPGGDLMDIRLLGKGCQQSSECAGSADFCLRISSTKKAGFCTIKGCTVDDYKTTLREDTCPAGFRCAAIGMSSGVTYNLCLQECTPSYSKNPCPASTRVSCQPTSSRYAVPGKAVCFYAACTSGADCPVSTDKTCRTTTDCRSSVGSTSTCDSNGVCVLPGNCTAGGICGPHKQGKKTAKVGDPCQSDRDCPEAGKCWKQSTSSSAIGPTYRNGYCTIVGCGFSSSLTQLACPDGSVCHHLYYGGACFKTCLPNIASECRGHSKDRGGDYECYNYTGWTYKGHKIAAKLTCQNASDRTCDRMTGTSTCASLASRLNSQNMVCRDRYTGAKKTNGKDPKGICLDDTASGPFDSVKDGGAWDAASDAGKPVKDAGAGG